MKNIFAALLAFAGMQSSFAQPAVKEHTLQHYHQNMLRVLLKSHEPAPAMRTTAVTAERVIAQSTKDNVLGGVNDSVSLNYTGNRGSAYDYNDMIYPYNYPYSTSPMFSFSGVFPKPQVLFDTLLHWTTDPNTLVYGFYEADLATYDLRQNTTGYAAMYNDSAIYPNRLFTNKFNIANNIDTAWSFNYIAGTADSAFKQFFTYNTVNKITKDSTYEYHSGAWHLASKTLYTYSTTNDLIQVDNYANTTDTSFTLPLVEQLQYINTYDVSHRLLTVAASYYNGTNFGPYVNDTFAYTGTHSYHTSWKEYQYDPINAYWAPMFYMTKQINTAGFPDTVNIKGFDSLTNAWVPQTMDVVHYTTLNNPDTLKDYEYNFTAFPPTPSITTTYYYQTYSNTTGIAAVAAANDRAVLFPNPAHDQVTISGLNTAAGAKISAAIISASGQMISKDIFVWHGRQEIATATLVPGIYWLVIQDAAGNVLHRQSVVKQ